ncbi:hypothetical protein L914_00138 [Phytophthora nicotianae]|uniref:Uncharacterized protein n=1 Tax=Phytophthora nicotianae TaxID=4792 RepID=W2P7L6_PHYNI|nr:hypothetical protein L914_00138 [Phytophthora nicotianae]
MRSYAKFGMNKLAKEPYGNPVHSSLQYSLA